MTPVGVFFFFVEHHAANQPNEESDQSDTEQTKQQLAPVESAGGCDVHAECRPVVLDEAQLEPVRKDNDGFVEQHVGLNPDFQCLIRYEQDDGEYR